SGQPVAASLARADEVLSQALPSMSDPADTSRWNASHQGKGRDIPRHNRPRGDEAVLAQSAAADDGGVGADRCAAPHQGGQELALAFDLRSRVHYVGEYTGRAAKDPVLERHSWIDRDIVLQLAAVTDRDAGPDGA